MSMQRQRPTGLATDAQRAAQDLWKLLHGIISDLAQAYKHRHRTPTHVAPVPPVATISQTGTVNHRFKMDDPDWEEFVDTLSDASHRADLEKQFSRRDLFK
ncbi:MAG: hypothetical protein JWO62_3336 [Acidimicrobiaceae bacterium]|nr:hypothetical protein [Acidimicrobiaceae bacterium]